MSRRYVSRFYNPNVGPSIKRPIKKLGKQFPRADVQTQGFPEPSQDQSSSDASGSGGSGDSGGQPEAPQESQEQSPQEHVQEEQPPQEQSQQETPTTGADPQVQFPLVSSHVTKQKLHTSAICITPFGCVIVHCCTRKPRDKSKFGLDQAFRVHGQIITQKGLTEKQKQYAGQLVDRAREGDQNAMAIIALVRDNAKKGVPRAQQSFGLLKQYIDSKPVFGMEVPATQNYEEESAYYTPASGRRVDFGRDPYARYKSTLLNFGKDNWASAMFANGPKLTNSKIRNAVSYFGIEDDQKAFVQGMMKWRDEHEVEHKRINVQLSEMQRQLLELGRIVGKARAIQVVRMPNSQIAKFNKKVAWELGE